MKHSKRIAIALACLLAAISATAQVDPLKERGFSADKAYQVGEFDSINTFNGNLILTIGLGGSYPINAGLNFAIGVSYNGDIWDLTGVSYDSGITWFTRAEPCKACNAGPGFMVSLGRLLAPDDPDNRSPLSWEFIPPDGSEHIFYGALHDGEPTYSGTSYSRDGSYLRMRLSGGNRIVESSDGTMRTFAEYQSGKWRITSISDQFGNSVTVTYPDANTWQISDMHGRTHYVRFTNGVVSSVELAKFGGGVANYFLLYSQDLINRSCEDTDPNSSDTLWVYRLGSIILPDGSSWSNFTYHSQTCNAPPAKTYPIGLSSRLAGLWMPTGARIEWEYGRYDYMGCAWDPKANPPTYNCSVVDATGVSTRTTKDALGDPVATWAYTNHTQYKENPTTHKLWADERILKVVDELGNATLHFSVLDSAAWDYGLAFQRFDPADSGGRYLSSSSYTGNPDVSCSQPPLVDACTISGGDLERSTYLKYEHDRIPASPVSSQDKRNTNRRVASQRTVFHEDDGDRDVITDSFNFNGLGAYRTTVTAGHSDLGPLHRTISNYTSWAGTYKISGDSDYDYTDNDEYSQFTGIESPAHNYSTTLPNGWPTSKPWILGSYNYEQQDQYDSTQNPALTTARQDVCFELDAGGIYPLKPFVLRKRVLRTGTTATTTDLLSVYAHDAGGNVTREQYYGGDTQALGTTALCPLSLPSQDVYRIDHSYQYGARRTSRYVDSGGNPLSFYTLDLDINLNTGLPSASRDSAGVQTSYEFDGLGRLSWVKPQTSNPSAGAWVEYNYTPFAGGATPTGARVRVTSHPNNQPTGAAIAGAEYEFDWQGRLSVERRLLPTGAWPASGACSTQCSQRVTTYNALGWKDSISEWQGYNPATVFKTEYLNFDSFGRAGTVRPPDGSAHDVTFAYSGIRKVDRTVSIATTPAGGETAALTTEYYDRHGRLVKVTERSGPSDANVDTTYRYDVGNRLAHVCAAPNMLDLQCLDPLGPNPPQQYRRFTYDNRGFLLSERLPEIGASGNGTATYSNYDARGHAARVQDGAHDLTYCYDRAERLGKILWPSSTCADSNPTNVARDFTYADANGTGDRKNGKLVQARSHSGPTPSDEPVTETYVYGGLGGRVSQRTTAVSLRQPAVETRSFTQSFGWNDLGALSWQQYPEDSTVPGDPQRTVINTYAQGILTRVCLGSLPPSPSCTSDLASSITYHANAMPHVVTHGNGVLSTYAKDDFDMPRPKSIATQNASANWSSGTYAFDGAGSVKAIGTDWHTYDLVSRLRSGSFTAWNQGTKTHAATYNAFGFMLTLVTNGATQTFTPDSAGATNHISGVTYDGAGNASTWGGFTYSWDRLNQLTGVSGGTGTHAYLYTPDGERIVDRWVNGGTTTVTLSARGLDKKVMREYGRSGSSWTWSKDWAYRDGLPLAAIDSTETRHLTVDHLGTPRLITGSGGATRSGHTYYPFGLEACSTTQDTERLKFTGHERDMQGTGTSQTDDLDYLHARFYNPNTARFLSVDPGRDVDPKVPQAWNMYAYVRNGPVNWVDPDGQAIETPWDAANVALDLASLTSNLAAGNVGGALVDAGGLVVDALATAVPGVPGGAGVAIRAARSGRGLAAEIHHIATNKSIRSGFTAQFKAIFSRAGISLNNTANKVLLEGHRGRHTAEYHKYVLDRLRSATAGLSGDDFRKALVAELTSLRKALLGNPEMVRAKVLDGPPEAIQRSVAESVGAKMPASQ